MKKLIYIFAVLLVTACGKDDISRPSDYNYPFDFNVQASNTMVAGEQSPINITIKNTGEHENPNKEYTMTFSTTGQGVIKNDKGQIFDNTHEIPIEDKGQAIKVFYNPTSSGNHTVTLSIKNDKGLVKEQKITYDVKEASFEVSVDKNTASIKQGETTAHLLTIKENSASGKKYQVSVNASEGVSQAKLNGKIIALNTKIDLAGLSNQKIEITFNKGGNFTPNIVVSQESKTMSIPLNISVSQLKVTASNIKWFQREANKEPKEITQIKGFLNSATSMMYLTADVQTETPTFKINLSSEKDLIQSLELNGRTYTPNTWISVTKADIPNIKIVHKESGYGLDKMKVRFQDAFENTSEEYLYEYKYYKAPTIDGAHTFKSYFKGQFKRGQIITDTFIGITNINAIPMNGNGAKIVEVNYSLAVSSQGSMYHSEQNIITKYDAEKVNYVKNWTFNKTVIDAWRNRNTLSYHFMVTMKNEFGVHNTINIASISEPEVTEWK